MGYEPTNWKTGDVITAEKLNKIEDGVGGSSMSYVKTEWKKGDVITAEKLNKLEEGVEEAQGSENAFSTAEVTLVNNCNESINLYQDYARLPIFSSDSGETRLILGPSNLAANSERTFTVVLYNDRFDWSPSMLTTKYSFSYEGNVDRYLVIYGDCKITFSPK